MFASHVPSPGRQELTRVCQFIAIVVVIDIVIVYVHLQQGAGCYTGSGARWLLQACRGTAAASLLSGTTALSAPINALQTATANIAFSNLA